MADGPLTALVSAVIPAYNAERWISQTIESVLGQTYPNIEVLVVDDGSTDGTADIIDSYADQVRTFHKANGGTASARNMGIRESRGEYVAFLDSDDFWRPDKVAQQVQLLQESPSRKWSYTDTEIIDVDPDSVVYRLSERTSYPEGKILRWLFQGNWVYFTASSVMIHQSIFSDVGLFDESPDRRISEDWDFWLQVADRYPIAYLDEAVTTVRRHPFKKTDTMDLDTALTCRRSIIERAVGRNPQQLDDLRQGALAHLYLGIAKKYLNREERSKARRLLTRALFHAPVEQDVWTYWVATWLPRPLLKLLGKVRAATQRLTRGTA